MALNHSPRIVTDGLVFAYDMANSQKSFKGKPTTNYIPYPYASHNGTSIVVGYNYPNNNASYTYVTGVTNPVNAPGVFQYYTGNTDYKYFSIDTTTIPTTGTYTFSYYARIVAGPSSSTNLSNSQLWRDNVLGDQAVSGDWNPTFTTEWRRYSTTGPVQAGSVLQYFPIHSGAVTGGYTIQYCGFQMEMGAFSTPFVVGTRSNTQALIDLIGNNTITANSLTYSSDGTFSIAPADSITLPPFGASTNTYTVSFWVKRNGGTGVFLYVGSGSVSAGCYFESYGATDISNWYFGPNSPQNAPWGNVLSSAAYTNVTAVVNTNDKTISKYINGVLIGSQTLTNAITAPGPTGTYKVNSGSQTWSGFIPYVKFYNRALSPAEVKQNFNALRGRYGI